jgi:hypothetical protein
MSQDVMTGYVEHQFENHPSVSTEFMCFLATNLGLKKVEQLAVTMKSVKEGLAKTTADALSAGTKADKASTKTDSLATDLASAI